MTLDFSDGTPHSNSKVEYWIIEEHWRICKHWNRFIRCCSPERIISFRDRMPHVLFTAIRWMFKVLSLRKWHHSHIVTALLENLSLKNQYALNKLHQTENMQCSSDTMEPSGWHPSLTLLPCQPDWKACWNVMNQWCFPSKTPVTLFPGAAQSCDYLNVVWNWLLTLKFSITPAAGFIGQNKVTRQI